LNAIWSISSHSSKLKTIGSKVTLRDNIGAPEAKENFQNASCDVQPEMTHVQRSAIKTH
jgi:hypothetical protein